MNEEEKAEVNVEEIVQDIRQNVQADGELKNPPAFEDIPIRGEADVAAQGAQPKLANLENSLQYVNAGYEIPYYWSFGPTGIKTFLKRVVRKLLKCLIPPILEKQNCFNAHVANCLNAINTQLEAINAQLEAINAQTKELFSQQSILQQKIDRLDRQSDAFSASVAKMLMKYRRDEGIAVIQEDTNTQNQQEKTAASESVYTILDYFKFQNDFRGTRSVILEWQKIYLPYFQNSPGPVIDIGCGRGEFLQLMKDNHITAFGIDLYPEYEVEGELSGLDIRQGDAIEFLKHSELQFGGIFAAQVIEHISFSQLQELCAAAYEKLAPGACLVLETPNPTCLSMFTSSFYLDPTHNKPVHPLLLEYLLKEVGFTDVQTIFIEASRVGYVLPMIESDAIKNLEEVNQAITRVSNFLYGSRDYAVIAKK